jgi:hypothetical protein
MNETGKPSSHKAWAAEFLLRAGESRELLGSWINSGAIHEAKKRRSTQVITCSFPSGKWLHMIGARASPRYELCRRKRRNGQEEIEHLKEETVPRIQNAGCKSQKKMMMMFFICCCRNKIGTELHIYLEEGTYHKRLFRGPKSVTGAHNMSWKYLPKMVLKRQERLLKKVQKKNLPSKRK